MRRRQLAASFPAFFLFSLAAVSAHGQIASSLVVDGLSYPTVMATPRGESNRLFVVEQRGAIRIVENGVLLPTPFLDIDHLVHDDYVPIQEVGMVGLVFHPNYEQNGHFYVVYYSNIAESVIERYTVSADPNIADPASAKAILVIDQPHPWHNVYALAFGPNDGYLYIGSGDGGWNQEANAQADDSLHGKLLRIDVDNGDPYAIPPTNPFVGAAPLDEIWAKGLRNPYRANFDRATGDLYIPDVGLATWEEVNFQPAASLGGENYGWAVMEGPDCHDPPVGCEDSTLVQPVHVYEHGGDPFRCSIAGGVVYRGSAIPSLVGHYMYADYCSGFVWTLKMVGGAATEHADRTVALAPGGGRDLAWLVGVFEDGAGELYLLDREDGELFKVVPATTAVVTQAPLSGFWMSAAHPNPFATSAEVRLRLAGEDPYHVGVYSASGRSVRHLASGSGSGELRVVWDGRDASGAAVPSGIYWIRAQQGTEAGGARVLLMH